MACMAAVAGAFPATAAVLSSSSFSRSSSSSCSWAASATPLALKRSFNGRALGTSSRSRSSSNGRRSEQASVEAAMDASNTKILQPTSVKEKAAATTKPAKEIVTGVEVEKPAAPKAARKAVVEKSLEKTMVDEVIPLLIRTLGKEEGITDLDVVFEDNQLKTSFAKEDIPYCFWAFFPDGTVDGSRGSSLTSYGSPPSTIEPFLIDEKKITPELLVFWIKKRLFAQKLLSIN